MADFKIVSDVSLIQEDERIYVKNVGESIKSISKYPLCVRSSLHMRRQVRLCRGSQRGDGAQHREERLHEEGRAAPGHPNHDFS